jgi:hypothetical protein
LTNRSQFASYTHCVFVLRARVDKKHPHLPE